MTCLYMLVFDKDLNAALFGKKRRHTRVEKEEEIRRWS